ncbi:c-type cytochrome [Flavobacteriales bacterium]|nr:c-type cytochrome [Flavobacteriales bacterium]
MKNLKNYTRGIFTLLAVFFISNSSFAAVTDTNQSGGMSNTTVFYILVTLAILLIIGILFISNSVKDLMKSDFYKAKIYEQEKKKRDNKNVVTTLLLLVGIPLASFSQAATIGAENADMPLNWIWTMVIINLILLGVVFYVRNLFFQILRTVKEKKVVVKDGEEILVNEPSKISQILTDIVPIEREHEIMMDHEYDGIHELDNNMPPWWLWSFYASIVFGIVYLFNYHIIETGDLQIAEYNKEIALGDEQVAAYLKTLKLNVDESNVVMLSDASDISKGKGLFDKKCVACHGKLGEGVIGPNLTDDNWIHGGSITDVFKIIKYGAPAKGMQAWKDELNPVEMQQVSSYIKSIRGNAIGIGKDPQGELYNEENSTDTAIDSTSVEVITAEL